MKKLLVIVCAVGLLAALASMSSAGWGGDGEGLYPFTRRHISLSYGQEVCLRVLDEADTSPGQFGWLTWDGDDSAEALAASLTAPGNPDAKYYNPGTPENGWTPNYGDNVVSVGNWVQGTPGKVNADTVRAQLDWHIVHKTPMVIPLYGAVAEQGGRTYYRVDSFAAFEIHSYEVSGSHPCIMGKFLRWVTNGN